MWLFLAVFMTFLEVIYVSMYRKEKEIEVSGNR